MKILQKGVCLLFLILLSDFGELQAGDYKLLPPDDEGIYFGSFPDFGGPEDRVSAGRVRAFNRLAGKKIAFATFSQNWFRSMKYPRKAIHAIHRTGAVPLIRMMPRSGFREGRKEQHFSLQKIIDGRFDPALRAWARAAKRDGIPLLVDFAVEMNGNWFGWSGRFNGAGRKRRYGDPALYDGPERYRDAYRHIIDIFRAERVHHITWLFHPNLQSVPRRRWNRPKYYYPGDDYIDWIGISLYGPMTPAEEEWELFDEALERWSGTIREISEKKPLALLEFGVTDHHPECDKSVWLENAFETIYSGAYLKFRAINYWHENWREGKKRATLRIDSSSKALKTFRREADNPRLRSKARFSSP